MFDLNQLMSSNIRTTALGRKQAKQLTVDDAIKLNNLNEAAKIQKEIGNFIMERICNLTRKEEI